MTLALNRRAFVTNVRRGAAHTEGVQYAASPRVEPRLLDGAERLDDRAQPMAETHRRLRALASRMDTPRPSYERMRLHLRTSRRLELERELERTAVRDLVFQLAFNTRRADHVIADLLALVDEPH